MKRILLVLLAYFMLSFSFASAQKREYDYTRGRETGSVTTEVLQRKDGNLEILINKNGERSSIICGSDFVCRSCHITDGSKDNELNYVLEGGIFRIAGRIDGKDVGKTVESTGNPWFQNLSVAIGMISRKDTSFRFETFRPFDTQLTVMEAKVICREKIGERTVLDVRVSPVGALSKFWHGDYYLDEKDRSLIKYTSVEGVPAVTPRTTWTLK